MVPYISKKLSVSSLHSHSLLIMQKTIAPWAAVHMHVYLMRGQFSRRSLALLEFTGV